MDREDQLREVIAHLGSALGQSDYTDDQIIIEHLRSAHHLALDALRSGGSKLANNQAKRDTFARLAAEADKNADALMMLMASSRLSEMDQE